MEVASDGFTLSVEGRRVLLHSLRHPCVEIGTSQIAPRCNAALPWKRPDRTQRLRLSTFIIEESSPNLVIINFAALLRLTARFAVGKLRITFSGYDEGINRLKLRLVASPKESIFGCGERFERLDLKGFRVPLWSEDRGSRRDVCPVPRPGALGCRNRKRWRSTYFPQPTFVSSEKYWVHVDVSSYSRFDFRNSKTTILETWEIPKEVVVGRGASPSETLTGLSAHIGRAGLLPAWTRKGVWLGVQGGTKEIRRKLDAALDAGAKIGAVWVQDWSGRRISRLGTQASWNWRADKTLYPELSGTISKLREKGVRFLGYINPFLAQEGELFEEARNLGFLVRNAEREVYLLSEGTYPAALLDLTNPQAFRWIKDIIKREMIGSGMSGWMADFGECLPVDAVVYCGQSAQTLHNRWPLLWAQANREAIAEAGKAGDVVAFHRSGWAGSSTQAFAFWAGSQISGFNRCNGIASVIPAGISAGISGAGFWHFDVGGCVTPSFRARNAECLKRWSEMGAFSPLFRTHEGNRPEANHQFWSDPSSLSHFARMTDIYASLEPYHETVAREFVEAGYPLIRHLWMHYEDDPKARSVAYQYLYGRDLLVAPVLKARETLCKAYLPEDEWIHLWSSQTFHGGEVTIEAPLGYPVVFYREKSIFASLFDSIRRNARKP